MPDPEWLARYPAKVCEYCHQTFLADTPEKRNVGPAAWGKRRFCSPKCASMASVKQGKGAFPRSGRDGRRSPKGSPSTMGSTAVRLTTSSLDDNG